MIIKTKYNNRISQGDIYKNVWCFENISQDENNLIINRVYFPYVVVLTQDCDMQQHNEYAGKKTGQLFSVLVAPIYNASSFMEGKHLENLGLFAPSYIANKKKGTEFKDTGQVLNREGILITDNQVNRFHYLGINDSSLDLPPSIVDFKNYFSIGVEYLKNDKQNDFVCRLEPLHRELLTQRFSNYLSRIGLPNPEEEKEED